MIESWQHRRLRQNGPATVQKLLSAGLPHPWTYVYELTQNADTATSRCLARKWRIQHDGDVALDEAQHPARDRDELRAQAVPPTPEDPTLTPNLDRFAGEALAATDMVATYPMCSPYRALLLSCRYLHGNGVLHG